MFIGVNFHLSWTSFEPILINELDFRSGLLKNFRSTDFRFKLISLLYPTYP